MTYISGYKPVPLPPQSFSTNPFAPSPSRVEGDGQFRLAAALGELNQNPAAEAAWNSVDASMFQRQSTINFG